MSAYIVDELTMNRVTSALAFREHTPSGNADAQAIGEELYAMNVCAVKARYPDDADDELPGPVGFVLGQWQYEDTLRNPRDVQALKSMHCLRYQCNEGDVPDSALYKWLTRQIGELADDLIMATPEYNAAEWG